MLNAQRGEVWQVDLGLAAKVRPAVIFSVPVLDNERAVYAVVPHTTALACAGGFRRARAAQHSRFSLHAPARSVEPASNGSDWPSHHAVAGNSLKPGARPLLTGSLITQRQFCRQDAGRTLEGYFGFNCGKRMTSRMLSWPLVRRSKTSAVLGCVHRGHGVCLRCIPMLVVILLDYRTPSVKSWGSGSTNCIAGAPD